MVLESYCPSTIVPLSPPVTFAFSLELDRFPGHTVPIMAYNNVPSSFRSTVHDPKWSNPFSSEYPNKARETNLAS